MKLVIIPKSLSIGDAIAYVGEQVKTPEGLSKVYTFATSIYFDRMKEKGLYLKDIDDINLKVEQAGMRSVFAIKLRPQEH